MKPEPKPDAPPPAAQSSELPAAPVAGSVPAEQLTPEEQMERFAQDQKENDWGHQPC
jgi:hypothetical protein